MQQTFRIRSPSGTSTLSVSKEATLIDLKALIYSVTDILPQSQQLKCGFPPAIVDDSNEDADLKSLGISSGETIIVDIKTSTQLTSTLPTHHPQLKPQNHLKNNQTSVSTADSPSTVFRRIIASDNSCLFNAVGYAMRRSRTLAPELRRIIADCVQRDPETYNEAFLGKPNEEYSRWIMKSTSWGGAIELYILAKSYEIQICAVSIQTVRCDIFGEDAEYPNRIYVIYDGIHYDVLVQNSSENAPESTDITIFAASDELVMQQALSFASELKRKRDFVDLSGFSLMCGVCNQGFTGQSQAVEHCQKTGHMNFQEVTK